MVCSLAYAEAHGLSVDARITGYASGATEPRDLFFAPLDAVQRLMRKERKRIGDYALIEINEAFAVQAITDIRALKLDPERVNVHGGAIALGHPIGASGARVLVTLLAAMEDRGAATGLATLCLGGGNAVRAFPWRRPDSAWVRFGPRRASGHPGGVPAAVVRGHLASDRCARCRDRAGRASLGSPPRPDRRVGCRTAVASVGRATPADARIRPRSREWLGRCAGFRTGCGGRDAHDRSDLSVRRDPVDGRHRCLGGGGSRWVLRSLWVLAIPAAAEEAMLRGYPLLVLTEAWGSKCCVRF